jgi:predicted DsbA family dithiol-disulfide isomerase
MGAAEAARCAGAQGKYWEFRAAALRMSGPPTPRALDGIARGLGLGFARFGACLRSRRYASAVRADLATAQRLGIRGVPAFVVGRVIGAWVVGRVIVGAKPLAIFERAIGRAAAATGSAR